MLQIQHRWHNSIHLSSKDFWIHMKDYTSALMKRLVYWMAEHGLVFLRISIGIIFLWFGLLKFFEGLSPVESLAIRTIRAITFELVSDEVAFFFLATLECLIGVGLLINKFLNVTLILLFLQMFGAVAPVFIFPSEVFTIFPVGLTLVGQYIIKDIIIISAAIVLGGTLRGGQLIADPDVAEKAKKVEKKKLE